MMSPPYAKKSTASSIHLRKEKKKTAKRNGDAFAKQLPKIVIFGEPEYKNLISFFCWFLLP